MKKPLQNKLDKVFSKLIREHGKCVRCGTTDNLQCCHIYSRANRAVRWDVDNALCMCAGCHFWAHQSPLEFAELCKHILGIHTYSSLRIKARTIKKWTNDEAAAYLGCIEANLNGEET